ncbi:hypothetical protein CRENBAI_024918 [Crenichthys baileyi]|uniref:Uncharacterized protein n=1 Tax=Crenichthys baileyi TaxID=28760 RepID=A0AAV9SQE3_9TELE
MTETDEARSHQACGATPLSGQGFCFAHKVALATVSSQELTTTESRARNKKQNRVQEDGREGIPTKPRVQEDSLEQEVEAVHPQTPHGQEQDVRVVRQQTPTGQDQGQRSALRGHPRETQGNVQEEEADQQPAAVVMADKELAAAVMADRERNQELKRRSDLQRRQELRRHACDAICVVGRKSNQEARSQEAEGLQWRHGAELTCAEVLRGTKHARMTRRKRYAGFLDAELAFYTGRTRRSVASRAGTRRRNHQFEPLNSDRRSFTSSA